MPETLDSSLCGLETIVGTCDPQEHCYHSVIIPKEDQSPFGDHPWPMGSWDGKSFSLWHQACSVQRRVEKRHLLFGNRTEKPEGGE